MENAGATRVQRRGVLAAGQAPAGGLHAIHRHPAIGQERMEQANGVGAAADTGDEGVGQGAGAGGKLLPGLAADDALEIPHHPRIGMGAGDRADDVIGVVNIRGPVAQGFVHRVLERARAGFDRDHLGAEQLHAVDIRRLADDVLGAHVHMAFEAEPGGDGGAGDAVLAGAGFGDDPGLAHVPREQRLADGIVHFVGAGMVQVFAFQPDAGAAAGRAQPFGEIDGGGPPDIVGEVGIEVPPELRIPGEAVIGPGEFGHGPDQGLADENAAVRTEMAGLVGPGKGRFPFRHFWLP